MEHKQFRHRTIRHVVSSPFIFMMIIPFIILDIFVEVYHRVCFPLYGLQYVKRRQYVVIDRYKLPYLKWYDKIFCIYCEYVNGLIAYTREIAARTEEYWCGIKHQEKSGRTQPEHHQDFMKYGDKKAYEQTCKFGKKSNKR